jgi:hypothetical protein
MATWDPTRSEVTYGLSGTLWPVHLKPLPDELLSSWIIRLAHAHGYKVETVCSLLFGVGSAIWNRDIDTLAPPEVASALIRATGATVQQFESTTIRAFEGSLFERLNANGSTSWVVPIGVWHRTRRRPGLMFCALCLASDQQPHFRRLWRLGFATCCVTHKVLLQDACPRCTSPIMPHRVDTGGKNMFPYGALITHCCSCGLDLRYASTLSAPDHLIALQARLETTLTAGCIAWAGNPNMYSLVFFNGLRLLMTGLALYRRKKGAMAVSTRKATTCDLSARISAMTELAEVLDDWPLLFVARVRASGFYASVWCRDPPVSAYWYENFIRWECYLGRATVTDEEAAAIANYVSGKTGQATGEQTRSLSGRDLSRKLRGRRPTMVSDDDFETLLASLDHEIADTQDQNERLALLRDKFMLSIARPLGLTLERLSALNVVDVVQINADTVLFLAHPDTQNEANAWLAWYVRWLRPMLKPRMDEPGVFTATGSGTRLKKSAISLRFKYAVDHARMRRQVPDFAIWRSFKDGGCD